MQTASTKKPGFKCPSFSVPAKPKADDATQNQSKNEKQSAKTAASSSFSTGSKKSKPTVLTSAGDNAKVVEHIGTRIDTSWEATVGASGDDHQKEPKNTEKKAKKQKEAKSIKPQKEKTAKKDKPPKKKSEALPERSLTDEEYRNLNIDDWEPRCTAPAKVKEVVKKKCCIKVGKKAAPMPNSRTASQGNGDINTHSLGTAKPVFTEAKTEELKKAQKQDADLENKVEIASGLDSDIGEEDDAVGDVHPNIDDEQGQVYEGNVIDGDAEDLEQERGADAVVDQDMPVLELERYNTVQEENEITPAGSEADLDGDHPPVCITPQPKKKKNLQSSNKQSKLEPRQLPFEVEAKTNVKKDKKKLKQTQDKNEVPKKKLKIETISKIKSEKTEMSELLKDSEEVPVKAKVKIQGKKMNKKKLMQEREIHNDGTWVQCCNPSCLKWRHLPDMSDPSEVPDKWICSMNKREDYNSCDKKEESYDESDHIYTQYTEGSIVWAKVPGYPWWPAMVELDPDVQTYFDVSVSNDMIPTHYHVVFFDDKVSRAWVRTVHVKSFSGTEEKDGVVVPKCTKKGSNYTKEVNIAKKNATRALNCNLKERIELFGFAARYKGSWGQICLDESISDHDDKNCMQRKEVNNKKSTKPDNKTFLDDSTMDDVLDNAEALLDNVEEMLESIGSELDDSAADSDFIPDKLVKVDKKTSEKFCSLPDKPSSSRIIKEPKVTKKMETIVSLDSEFKELHKEDQVDNNGNNNENGGDNDFESLADDIKYMEKKDTNVEKQKAQSSFKFDPDIFTMELDDDTEKMGMEKDKTRGKETRKDKKDGNKKVSKKRVVAPSVNEEKESVGRAKKPKNKIKEGKESIAPVKKLKKKSNSKKESTESMSKSKVEKGLAEPVKKDTEKSSDERELAELKGNDAKKITKPVKRLLNKKNEEEKAFDMTKDKINSNLLNGISKETDGNIKLNNDKEVSEEKNTLIEDEKSHRCDIKEQNVSMSVHHFDSDVIKDKQLTVGKDNLEKGESVEHINNNMKKDVNSYDEFNLQEDHENVLDVTLNGSTQDKNAQQSDRCQGEESENEFDIFEDNDNVQELCGNGKLHDRNDRSLEGESENEFDLEEHTLYDGDVEGADKLMERDIVHVQHLPVGVTYSGEDSDPFDMMEE